jgi:hypothetical protein
MSFGLWFDGCNFQIRLRLFSDFRFANGMMANKFVFATSEQ